MPYIVQENRPYFDNMVVEVLKDGGLYNDELIYILFEYCKQCITPSYNNYKNFCGELNQCAIEIERRTKSRELSIIDVDSVDPFVFEDRKELCDEKVAFMKEADIKVNGDLNYSLYAYAIRNLKSWDFSDFTKQLRLSAKKITTEILAPYEDSKIEQNGDVL